MFVAKRSPQVGFGPPDGVRADIYAEANEYCSSRGKLVETVDLKTVNSGFGRPASAALQFRCVEGKKS
ncbi:hypothetical protein DFLDMN_001518 [Cupriavidus sp. H19C3]